jgi:hypothetical protein
MPHPRLPPRCPAPRRGRLRPHPPLKPEIPVVGDYGIPLRDWIELGKRPGTRAPAAAGPYTHRRAAGR